MKQLFRIAYLVSLKTGSDQIKPRFALPVIIGFGIGMITVSVIVLVISLIDIKIVIQWRYPVFLLLIPHILGTYYYFNYSSTKPYLIIDNIDIDYRFTMKDWLYAFVLIIFTVAVPMQTFSFLFK